MSAGPSEPQIGGDRNFPNRGGDCSIDLELLSIVPWIVRKKPLRPLSHRQPVQGTHCMGPTLTALLDWHRDVGIIGKNEDAACWDPQQKGGAAECGMVIGRSSERPWRTPRSTVRSARNRKVTCTQPSVCAEHRATDSCFATGLVSGGASVRPGEISIPIAHIC